MEIVLEEIDSNDINNYYLLGLYYMLEFVTDLKGGEETQA